MSAHEVTRQHRRGTCSCARQGAADLSRLARAGVVIRQVQGRVVTGRRRELLAAASPGVTGGGR